MSISESLNYLRACNQTPGLALITNCSKGSNKVYCSGHLSAKDESENECITAATRFQVASLSKFITACLVHELKHRGCLQINENARLKCGDALISCAIHDLLSNRGGFTAGSRGFEGTEPKPNHTQETSETIERLCTNSYTPSLAGVYKYSGCNYWFLQKWLETKFDMPFENLLQDWICSPLGLKNTTSQAPSRGDSVAIGHDAAGKPLQTGWKEFKELEAAAGIWSSAEDMRELMRILLSVRSNSSLDVPKVRLEDLLQNGADGYHHGIMLKRALCGYKLFHSGINPGYYSYMAINLEYRKSQILLSNKENGEALRKSIITIK